MVGVLHLTLRFSKASENFEDNQKATKVSIQHAVQRRKKRGQTMLIQRERKRLRAGESQPSLMFSFASETRVAVLHGSFDLLGKDIIKFSKTRR